ncbi:MAG: hypothetical protein Q8P79_01580 [Nanoarchaeota archaeon]|nr:hypothetical protein [Nanoarchaeota archaeon]
MLHLHPEQNYVFEVGRELGYQPRLIHHERPTISCAEKLDLLRGGSNFADWTLDRIVKALYFNRNGLPFIGVITPEFERNLKPKDIFPKPLGMSRGNAERYWINPEKTPSGMVWGTCSPFPLLSSVEKEISDLIFLDHKLIRDKLVDISVGGSSKEMFQTSMHLPYIAIYEILKKQFGNSVHFIL